MPRIVIVDYGMGNLRSVQKALERFGHAAVISGEPQQVAAADKLIVPGIGAFRDAIARLRDSGLDRAILRHLEAGKPFFGICLGLQLLFTVSHEDGRYEGLGWFAGCGSPGYLGDSCLGSFAVFPRITPSRVRALTAGDVCCAARARASFS